MKPLSFFSLLCLIFLSFACRNTEYYLERERDPDTVDAIRKFNQQFLKGQWILNSDSRRVYMEFEGDRYTVVVWQGDRLQVSDLGEIVHNLPGEVWFVSSNESCSASSRDAVFFQFDIDTSTSATLLLPNRLGAAPLQMVPSESIEVPAPGVCLWDNSTEENVKL